MRRLSSRVGAGESWGEGGQGRAQRDRAVVGWGGLDRAGVGWGGPGWAGLIGARQGGLIGARQGGLIGASLRS